MRQDLNATLDKDDMEEHRKKADSLQAELEMRNAQLAQLQKQMADLEQHETAKARFDNMKTVESKIALEHLFEKYVDAVVSNGHAKSEVAELRTLYEEAVKNTNELEKEIATLKNDHETEVMQKCRQHEEKVLFLLNKMGDSDEAGAKDVRREAEMQMCSKLQAELAKISSENEKLRLQMLSDENNKKNVKIKKPTTSKTERYTAEEFDEMYAEDSDEDASDNDGEDSDDPDWGQTPLIRRIRNIRNEMTVNHGGGLKRKPDDELDANKPKRPSQGASSGCSCKTGCSTKRCACRKAGNACSAISCRCSECKNDVDASALSDLTNASDNTMSLLQNTLSKSPFKSPTTMRTNNTSYFKSPLLDKEN